MLLTGYGMKGEHSNALKIRFIRFRSVATYSLGFMSPEAAN